MRLTVYAMIGLVLLTIYLIMYFHIGWKTLNSVSYITLKIKEKCLTKQCAYLTFWPWYIVYDYIVTNKARCKELVALMKKVKDCS